ncbi:hypothetical protein NDU88_001457 [Pleurodeles waltl]|uniref:Uncharacterized protein n=1 Tax=Pleurodeles waltl TaxID=8319 RepID=A0AAV7V9N4_PLEWA|nr:hypothetical protein NDU88_001457 [Pleurodeles waltl]
MEQDPPPSEPSLSEIMAAIHDMKGSLEPWLDAVAVDVGLLRADLQKVSEKVSTAETDIARLESTPKALEEQVRFLTVEHGRMAARLEDQEGRVQRNNIRAVGVQGMIGGKKKEQHLQVMELEQETVALEVRCQSEGGAEEGLSHQLRLK